MKFNIGLLFAGAGALLPSAASASMLFTSGHADIFAVGFEGGALEPHFHAEGATIGGVSDVDGEFEADEITTVVPQSTFDFWTSDGRTGRPSGSAWDPIGVVAGESFWFLPQSNTGPGGAATLGAPFAGVGTEELTDTDWSGDITITLDSVSGPGHFSMYLDGVTPFFVMSSVDGVGDVLSQAAGGHEHYNWAFTAPGTYDIGVTVRGEHVTEGPQAASATYQFQVIPEPSTALLGFLSAGLLLRRRR